MIFNILAFSCPLILCSIGALFSEYAGALALFLEGMISFSAFLNYAFTVGTHSAFLGFLLSSIVSTALIVLFSLIIEKFKANKFIAGIALNLLFSSLPSCLSALIFGNRGVFTITCYKRNSIPFIYKFDYVFNLLQVRIFSVVFTVFAVVLAFLFLYKTRNGLYLRITGSDANVLLSNGVSPLLMRTIGWGTAALYSSFAGCLLSMRLSSFVPNISSGRGWMALAAVFVGQKKLWKILVCMIIFCCADFFSANIQNIMPNIPSSVLLAFPYLIVLCLVFSNRV